ncbi:E1-E2 ATPase-domain-containing protein [Pilobolus umbonatus]|nr:E1-E2 ATPase-domain-containing protein [Pilobolus umbonatus]
MMFINPDLTVITTDKIRELIDGLGYETDNVSLENMRSTENPSTRSEELKTMAFSLSGLTCDHCVKTVTDALKALPGVIESTVSVDLDTQKGRFSYENPDFITTDKIQKLIEGLGYDMIGKPRLMSDPTDLASSWTQRQGSFSKIPSIPSSFPQTKRVKVVMRVLGMTCSSCVSSVKDALKNEIPNVEEDSVYVNLQTEMAMFICIDPQINIIKNVIEERGFEAENIQVIHNLVLPAVLFSDSEMATTLIDVPTQQKPVEPETDIVVTTQNVTSIPEKVSFQISGMTCASCVRTIQQGLSKLPGVDKESVHVNLLTHSGSLVAQKDVLDENTLVKAVEEMGYSISDIVFTKTVSEQVNVSVYGPTYKAEMIITGMFCGACVEKVHAALMNLYGIQGSSIQIDLNSGRTEFEFTGEYITRQRIYQAILQLGFSAESIKIKKTSNTLDSISVTSHSEDRELATAHLTITGMTCSSCVANIERTMMKHRGIFSCQVNLLSKSAVIQYDPSVVGARSLAQMIEQIGYKAELNNEIQNNTLKEQRELMRKTMEKELQTLQNRFLWSLLFAIPTVLISMVFMMALPSSHPIRQFFTHNIVHGLSRGDLLLFLLATPVQFWFGWPYYEKAYKALVYTHSANMETLVAMGTTVAYVSSIASILQAMARPDVHSMTMNYFETSVLLITFINFGKWLEALAKGKTAETITKLMDLQPEKAILVELMKDSDVISGEREIDTADIQVGDILKVNPGGSIPCDGKVWKGESSADESMITGESLPVSKKEGDSVITATINLSSTIYVRAIRVGSDTTLARIVQLVQDAQASPKAPIEKLADDISSVFVPIVIALAVLTFVIWEILIFNNKVPEEWLPVGESKANFALMLGVSVLVIACPCGLGLASPTAVMVGTGVAADHGVLVKGGGYSLEMANRITTVAFDKTGTLTAGKPSISHCWIEQANDDPSPDKRIAIWRILGCVGSASNHPLSKSIEKKARYIISELRKDTTLKDSELFVDDVDYEEPDVNISKKTFDGVRIINSQEIPGRGVLATLSLSEEVAFHLPKRLKKMRALNVFMGNQEWMRENHARYQNINEAKSCLGLLEEWKDLGKSVVLVSASPLSGNEDDTNDMNTHTEGCKNNCVCAVCYCSQTSVCCTVSKTMMIAQLAIADVPRPEASQLIAELRKRDIEVWMITGDNQKTGEAIGKQLGIPKDFVLAEVKPEKKADKIRNLQKRGIRVHMPSAKTHTFWKRNGSRIKAAVVAMVGDGINDSPALAQADVGVAVGSATDIAIETASIVLIRNNLMDFLTMYDISRTVVRRIRLNFLWAFIYNIVAIPLAAGILYPIAGEGFPPYVAGIAMAASSVSVVCSSLLLRLYKPPQEVQRSHQIRI